MGDDTDILRSGVLPADAKAICVVVHGRGQSPEAMQGAIVDRLNSPGIAYILPRAAGGSWYDARAVDALTEVTKASLAGALASLGDVITMAKSQMPGLPLVLVGFSQGACLSLEYAFANGPWKGALVALTGCRVGSSDDTRPALGLGAMPVYLTGSDVDPWIPVAAFAEAVAALGHSQARLRTDLFPGRAHEVSDLEIAKLNTLLADLGAGRPVSWAARDMGDAAP